MDAVRKYLSTIGRKGGLKSRRTLDASSAREMVRVREARRAFKKFYTQCFWSYDLKYSNQIGPKDVSWVAEELMKKGGREAWQAGAKLCR